MDGSSPTSAAEVVERGCWCLCRHSGDFPEPLTALYEGPTSLFAKGDRANLELLSHGRPVVTIVGARRASSTALRIAEGLGLELSRAGVTVVSGMASGIDLAAHRGALRGSTPTVAVLGSGPDVCYPRAAHAVYREIVETGLVLSQFPPGGEPRQWTFPARNRVMAALGMMTVVVEARRSSGSLITASAAAELGREVGAVPGSVVNPGTEGSNSLLRDGAQVIRDARDVLDSIFGPGIERTLDAAPGPRLDDRLQAVLEAVIDDGASMDEVAVRMDGVEVQADVARLELMGYLIRDRSGGLVRTTLPVP